jgi:hypothetical protein
MGKLSFYLTGVATLLSLFAAVAAAEDCDAHAAAMVAEMQASRTTPLSDSAIALIRETALKSCKATSAESGKTKSEAVEGEQSGAPGSEAVQPEAAAEGEAAAGKAAPEKEKDGFWKRLAEKMATPHAKKEGQDRLKSRSSGQP